MKWLVVGLLLLKEHQCAQECCPQIFLQSSGELGTTQSAVLGIYTITNQKLANTPHPIYAKRGEESSFHVYYRNKENEPKGWIVGGELLEDSFYITTGQSAPECPQGIVGGKSGGNDTKVDRTFSIDCHTDEVRIPCCKNVNISAEGAIKENQGGSLGEYKQVGDLNGHPLYKGGHMDSFLFYRKAGSGPDGWVISTTTDENMFMVTTRAKEYCPDAVSMGYDRNTEKDDSLNIVCMVEYDVDVQDPGVPAVPAQVNKDAEALRTNTAVLNMVSLRIICVVYLWVINQ